nr:hypothetical protein OH820_09700 [Streptomyces sp. NBC_00857]
MAPQQGRLAVHPVPRQLCRPPRRYPRHVQLAHTERVNAFLAQVTDTGAQALGRLRSNRRTPVLTRLVDGSCLSVIGTVKVRIIDAQIAVTCADGTSFTGSYRPVTTLTDARRYPPPRWWTSITSGGNTNPRTTRSATPS